MAEETVYFSFTGCLTPELNRRVCQITYRRLMTVCLVVGIVAVLFGLLSLYVEPLVGALMLVMGIVMCCYKPVLLATASRRFAGSNSIQLNMPYTVSFTDTAMVSQTPYGYVAYPYAKIAKVVDTPELILVYTGVNQLVPLEKRCITAGDPSGFFPFLCNAHGVLYKKG